MDRVTWRDGDRTYTATQRSVSWVSDKNPKTGRTNSPENWDATGAKIIELSQKVEILEAEKRVREEADAENEKEVKRISAEVLAEARDELSREQALERHCEELEKRNAELEAALPKLQGAVNDCLYFWAQDKPRPLCAHCREPLFGGGALMPVHAGGIAGYGNVHDQCAIAILEKMAAQDKDSPPEPERD